MTTPLPIALIIWFLSSLFYAYQYVIRIIPAISTNEIITRFGVDVSQFGYLCGIYYIGYTSMSIPLGIVIDRYSPKIVLPCAVLVTALGVLPLAFFDVWYLCLLGRLISGMGSVCAILGVFKVIAIYFSQSQSSKMLGMAATIGLLGAIYGGKPMAAIMQSIGWEQAIMVLCACSLLLAILMYVTMPSYMSNCNIDSDDTSTIMQNIKTILSNKTIILLSIAGGLMVGPLEGFTDAWSVVTLEAIYGWTKDQATIAPSMIFIGMAIGTSLVGYVTAKTQKYYDIITISAVGMILCFFIILHSKITCNIMVYTTLILIGIFSAYQITLLSKVGIIASARLVAMTTAIANMIIMSFGSIFHAAIGHIVNYYSNGNPNSGYTSDAIVLGMYPIIIGLVTALPIVYVVKKLDKKT